MITTGEVLKASCDTCGHTIYTETGQEFPSGIAMQVTLFQGPTTRDRDLFACRPTHAAKAVRAFCAEQNPGDDQPEGENPEGEPGQGEPDQPAHSPAQNPELPPERSPAGNPSHPAEPSIDDNQWATVR